MKYQFEMPLEEHVSEKNIFGSTLIGKKRERKKITSHIVLLSYQPIGCAGWLCWLAVVTQKTTKEVFFFIPIPFTENYFFQKHVRQEVF